MVTIHEEFAENRASVMSRYGRQSDAAVVEHAANLTLAREGELSGEDLIEMVTNRIE